MRSGALLSLSVFFVLAGTNHFANPTFYVDIMPTYLPAHLPLVLLSGALEALGGVAILVPAVRVRAGHALIGLLLAVFPANIHMALNASLFPDISMAFLVARLPLQGVLIAWVYWATHDEFVHP